jgi:hypothetical protein
MEYEGGNRKMHELKIQSPPDMALGCFIGVMVLLVIVILFLAFSDQRLNQMLTNQNNQLHALNMATDAIILYKLKNRNGDNA